MRMCFANRAAALALALTACGLLAAPAQAGLFGPRVVVVPSSAYVVAPTTTVYSTPVVVPAAVPTTYVAPAPVVTTAPTRAVYIPSATVVAPPVPSSYLVPAAAPVVVRPARAQYRVQYVVPRTYYVLP